MKWATFLLILAISSGAFAQTGDADYVQDSLYKQYFDSGNYDEALGIAIQRLNRAVQRDSFSNAARYAYNAAASSYFRGNLAGAQDYVRRGLRAAARANDETMVGRLYLIQSITKMNENQLDSVRHYAYLGAAAENRMGDPERAANVLVRVASSYEMEKNYEAATPIFRQYADTVIHYGNKPNLIGYALMNLAGNYSNRFLLHADQPELLDTAWVFYDSAHHVLQQQNRQYELVELLALKSRLYAGSGDSLSAINTLLDYNDIRDSIREATASDDLARLQAEFDAERRDATILTQRETIGVQRTRNWLFGGLALLAVGAGVGFYLLSQRLRKRNRQNEFLVKEIHHRTKNNLQVLSSLLSLQTDYIEDPAALDAVNEGRNRVQSIGLLHQQLYTGTELSTVDPAVYFPNLGEHLLDTFEADDRITINYTIDAPALDVDTAIPLGLIANELLTNSLKYAYPDAQSGTIDFQLGVMGKELVLRVEDYGVGEAGDVPKSTSFGRDLIDILKDKLKATVTETTVGGRCTKIRCRQFTVAKAALT